VEVRKSLEILKPTSNDGHSKIVLQFRIYVLPQVAIIRQKISLADGSISEPKE
jgi:hypothetical protein